MVEVQGQAKGYEQRAACSTGPLTIPLLVMLSPDLSSTFPIFEDMARSVHEGLLALGHESQRRDCADLRSGCGVGADVLDTQVRLHGLC